jgi:hypothetical protein
MTIHQSAYDESQGSPNLEAMQYIQENWGPDQISAAVQVAKVSVTASGTSGVAATIPVGAEIMDMVVHCNASVGGGTARLRVGGGGANISDAVVMATLDAITRCASIDQTYKVVGADGVEIVTNADTNLGDIYLYYKK